jgi:clan AA aspartic protease
MGFTYARIELVNADDQALVRRKLLPESKVRKTKVKALVDSGASSIAINERIQKKLGLPLFRTGTAELADGSKIPIQIVGPVSVKFKNRATIAYAHVLPRNAEPLLGTIPLEDMDLIINPKKQKLDVNPASPDEPLIKIK